VGVFQRLGLGGEGGCIARPIVERGRIEVGTIGPNQGMAFWINADLAKYFFIAERTEERTPKHRKKVDALRCAVVKTHAQCIVANDFKTGHFDDKVLHGVNLDKSWRCGLLLPHDRASM
jgi:hypothetical protein